MSKTLSGQLKPCYDSDAELLKKIKAGEEIEWGSIKIAPRALSGYLSIK